MNLLISIVPLFLSIVAIYVSLSIARKQNKIALYDKRIDCYMKLQEYFESPMRWPTAIASKCYETKGISKNSYTRAKEADKLFLTAELLFSDKIATKLKQIRENDKGIAWRDSLIEMNLAHIEHNEVISNRILELFKDDALTLLTDDEREELKELCRVCEYTYSEQTSATEWVEYRCNMYEFSEEQDKLSGINQKLEKEVIQEMKEEIQVGKLK